MTTATETVKCTPTQRKRLITALAYISTHRKEWKQGVWRCGTGMCLAGHLSLTTNPSRPLVPIKDLVEAMQIQRRAKASTSGWESVTDEERKFFQDVNSHEDYLLATAQDDPDAIVSRTYNGKHYSVVSISDRARRLIGDLAEHTVDMHDDVRMLFNGDNNYTDLVRITASALGTSTAEVKREIAAAVTANGWDQQLASA